MAQTLRYDRLMDLVREIGIVRAIIAALPLLLLIGCASVYRQHGVISSDPSKIAVIEDEPCRNNQCLVIQEIDGKWRGVGWIKRYELVPGTRTLKFVFKAGGAHGQTAILVQFEAKAGRTYVTKHNANYGEMKWKPEVVDVATQEVVSTQVGTAFAY
jgi:hypothetical protein